MAQRTVLIAADFYGRSDLALHRGLVLAAEQGADVTLMSIVNETIPEEFACSLAHKTRDHLNTVARDLGKNVNSDITVETGDPVTRCLDLIGSEQIGLVVVGPHHKRGVFDDLKKPTVFWSIAANARCPVLLAVRPVHGTYRRVLVPTAFSTACRRAVLSAHQFAPNGSLRIFHVSAPDRQVSEHRSDDLKDPVLPADIEDMTYRWATSLPDWAPKVDMIEDRVGPGVHRMIARYRPDLLAIGARRCDVSRTGLGSYASKLLRDPPTDLLICRGSPEE